jgi:nicotinate-nucleotide adenylyltransferase
LVNSAGLTVALFGGSFDPPHSGHQQIVEKALAELEIDRLIILPAYLNPFKSSSLADASQRLEWCHALFGDIPKVMVSDFEIRQHRSVRTAESVRHFNQQYHVKYLIIGADNLSTLTQWYDFAWLNAHVTWVIATRPGFTLQTDMLRSWRLLTLDVPVSSSRIREENNTTTVDTKIATSVQNILEGQTLDDNRRKN